MEEQNAVERKKLVQALLENLQEKGIKAEPGEEPALNCLGDEVLESIVNIREQNLSLIRLVGMDGSGCGVPGDNMRFQYMVKLDQPLPAKNMKDLTAYTVVIRDGKVVNYFGGKADGIKWSGEKLAEALNNDQTITDDIMRCVKSWSYLEFQIEAASPTEVLILGPRFSNPGAIADLYHSENSKEDVQCCAFGYATVNKIAGHIKDYRP